jgi:hypothetical protein
VSALVAAVPAGAVTHEIAAAERIAPAPSGGASDSPVHAADAGIWFWLGEAPADRELPGAGEARPTGAPDAVRMRAFTFEAETNPDLGQTLFYVRAAQPLERPCVVEIRDAGGRVVRRLDGAMARGSALFVWDGCGAAGEKAVPGAYFAKLDDAGDALSRNDIER